MTVQPKSLNVLVIGDVCVDEYVKVKLSKRINPESAAPLYEVISRDTKLGMAANVAEGLRKLGLTVKLLGPKNRSIKTRIFIGDTPLMRVDKDIFAKYSVYLSDVDFNKFDAVVISDYNKGYVTEDSIVQVLNLFKGPVFLDSKKKDLSKFTRCIIKINRDEYYNISAYTPLYTELIVTCGKNGSFNTKTGQSEKAFPAVEIDVCGAGDAYLVGLVFGTLTEHKNPMRVASVCASICVENVGVYNPSLDELRDRMK